MSDFKNFLNELPDDSEIYESSKKIIVGICAMNKKSSSAAMKEIVERLELFDELDVIIFEEEIILDQPIEDWPIVNCLISFHSKGFPLDKAINYIELRKPFVINDLYMQNKIQDRRDVYKELALVNVNQPRFAYLNRDGRNEGNDQKTDSLVEEDDHVWINGILFTKPFVEKPVSAEDHNVYIYYPSSAGGGSQRLFRKIGSRSSVYSPVSKVRKTGSYIYEDFMPTDGTDVKVYTVGPEYAHAEARKSPALDGKVERDKDGKEIRYPVLLSAQEKLMARKIVEAFRQNICGFDLLRANGKSYVCDVNGFSFVKNSSKYYDDCAKILGDMILREFAPSLPHISLFDFHSEDIPIVPTTSGTRMELRCVTAVMRHGDRTPKQKMKMVVKHKKFLDLFERYGGHKTGQLKLKKPQQLQEILDITRYLVTELHSEEGCESIEEKKNKLEQLKSVLEMYGHFSGINRKVQLKYHRRGFDRSLSEIDDDSKDPNSEPSLILILKWGGELTEAGIKQAEELGKAFRCMYPGGKGDYGGVPGLGLLRLHSTFRHDLKIYASEEGRVQMTAAAFAKGLLALEGELTPILVQMVKSANMNGLLDNDNESDKFQNRIKAKLQYILNKNENFTKEDYESLGATSSISLTNAMYFIKNPFKTCEKIYNCAIKLLELVKKLANESQLCDLKDTDDISIDDENVTDHYKLYKNESWELMVRRWAKLVKDFRMKDNKWDISKIPDIYDCIKYDLQHNHKYFEPESETADQLYASAKALADIIIPQEYGITKEEKLQIGQCICTPLMKKIQADLHRNIDEGATRLDSRYSTGVSTPHRHVRTRLYFTSESHIHSLLNIIRLGGLCKNKNDEQWQRSMNFISEISELNYMTQIIIMVYEDRTKELQSEGRFHVELHFSPGAYHNVRDQRYPTGLGYRPAGCQKNLAKSEEISSSESNLVQKKRNRIRQTSLPTVIHEKNKFDSYSERVEKFRDTLFPLPDFDTVKQGLISTSVISGSLSAPSLSKIESGVIMNITSGNCWAVPSIRPLETMHNSLTLKRMENFLTKIIDSRYTNDRPKSELEIKSNM
ncbi:DgyrCDS12718 [Dimorphilus gyrociliatus]|uniref:Inositol hexakisphosphate and diphosphoinositol-pentakisphosphate kinase n=1 Tax=Dimorphilus gyrociliatus TaxID=2664684 RepID=A0A7I8W7D4_9ANNE|nr:DgyrCDS12718 [Dimorphilus gyrociliatus]